MSCLARTWWLKEQNMLSALSCCFPAPSIRSVHWPYNSKAVSPIYSGEIPEVSGNFDLRYIFFQKPLLNVCDIFAVSIKRLTGIRGRLQPFLNAPPDPTLNGKMSRYSDLHRKSNVRDFPRVTRQQMASSQHPANFSGIAPEQTDGCYIMLFLSEVLRKLRVWSHHWTKKKRNSPLAPAALAVTTVC